MEKTNHILNKSSQMGNIFHDFIPISIFSKRKKRKMLAKMFKNKIKINFYQEIIRPIVFSIRKNEFPINIVVDFKLSFANHMFRKKRWNWKIF